MIEVPTGIEGFAYDNDNLSEQKVYLNMGRGEFAHVCTHPITKGNIKGKRNVDGTWSVNGSFMIPDDFPWPVSNVITGIYQ